MPRRPFDLGRLARSFLFALEGLGYVLRTQPNARIHALITLLVIALGLWLRLEPVDWAILVLAIMVVWVAEFVNTALEALVDLTSPEENSKAKIAKDVAAAAVLVASAGAVIVGLIIMGPPLVAKLN
jgi:diacylglycerol kinase